MLQPLQPPVDGSKSLQAEEDEELARLMRQLHSAREKCHPSFAAVPKFYSSNGATPIDSSPSAVADAWRSRVLQQRLGLEALHRHLEAELNLMLGQVQGHSLYRLPRANLPPIASSPSLRVADKGSKHGEAGGQPPSSTSCPPPGLELENAWPEARATAAKAIAAGWRQLSARLHSDGALARASPPDDRGGRVNYDGVQRLRDWSPPFWRRLLTGRCFLSLARDAFGRVACADLKRAVFEAARLRFQALDLSVFAYLSAAANAAKDTPPSPSSSPLAPLHAPPLGTDPLMLGRWANAPSSSAYGSRSSKSADSGSNHSSSTTTTTNWLSGLKLSEDDLMAWVRSHCRSSSSSKTHDSGQLANSRRCPLLRPEHEDDFFGIFVFTAVRRLLFYLDTAPRRRQVSVAQLLASPLSLELLDFAQLLKRPWPVPPPLTPSPRPSAAAETTTNTTEATSGENKDFSADEDEYDSPWDPYGHHYSALQPALRAIGAWARQQRTFVSCFVGTRQQRRKINSHHRSSDEDNCDDDEYEHDAPSPNGHSSHGYAHVSRHSSSSHQCKEADFIKQQQASSTSGAEQQQQEQRHRDVSVVLLIPCLPSHRNTLRQTLESVVENSHGALHFVPVARPKASNRSKISGSHGDGSGSGGAVGDDLWPLLQADGLLGPPPPLPPASSSSSAPAGAMMTHETEGYGALSGGQVQSVEWNLCSSSSTTTRAAFAGDDHHHVSASAASGADTAGSAAAPDFSPSIVVSLAATNWLSADAPNSHYREYLELDKDENGMLSASELADFRCSGDTFPVGSDAAPSVFGPPAKLSQVFLQRLFEEVVTFQSPSSAENGSQASSSTFSSSSTSASSELDYRLFLDFVMAFDALREKPPPPPPPPLPLLPALPTNTSSTTPPPPPPSRAPHSPKNSTSSTDESSLHCVSSNSCSKSTRGGGSHVSAALRYFWPLLDVHHCGYLDSSTLAYLFGSVRRRLIRSGASGSSSDGGDEANAAAAPLVGDVLDEIFDMVKPQDAGKITLQDLVTSRMGHTVVSMLIDAEGFTRYDRRESLMHDDDDDDEGGRECEGDGSESSGYVHGTGEFSVGEGAW